MGRTGRRAHGSEIRRSVLAREQPGESHTAGHVLNAIAASAAVRLRMQPLAFWAKRQSQIGQSSTAKCTLNRPARMPVLCVSRAGIGASWAVRASRIRPLLRNLAGRKAAQGCSTSICRPFNACFPSVLYARRSAARQPWPGTPPPTRPRRCGPSRPPQLARVARLGAVRSWR